MNFKNIIPIKTHTHAHTHLINTCSNKFGATLGLKNVCKSKNCSRKISWHDVHIIIIHYKHWLYDSTTPIWLYTLGLNITGKIVFLTVFHILIVTSTERDLASSEKYKNRCFCFCKNATWMRILASKCHRSMITRWYVKRRRRYCRPRIHKITKDY